MGSLLYLDDSHAICAAGKRELSGKSIKLLLQLNPLAPNLEKQVIPLLDAGLSWSVAFDYMQTSLDLPQVIFESVDFDGTFAEFVKQEPSAFNFSIDGGRVLEAGLSPLDSCIYSLNLDNALWGIARIAEGIQYISKLYLLSEGTRKFSDLVPDIPIEVLDYDSTGRDEGTVEISLPMVFRYYFANSTLRGAGVLGVNEIEPASLKPFFSVVFEYKKSMLLKGRFVIDAKLLHDAEFAAKESFALVLVNTLMCYTASNYSEIDAFGKLKRADAASIWSVLFDCLIGGLIKPCPHCSDPTYVPLPTSKPFCKAGCQQRYKEKAQHMLNDGASVDEVAEAFPHINRKTIENWPRPEGR